MLSDIEIIDGFGKIMTGYLLFMEHSEMVNKSKYIDTILYNGANIVIHVFTMHVYSQQNLENIYNQCCKAYVCYLEYIEQLDKNNLANNLYISDISIFVYKLTLGELDVSNNAIMQNNEYSNKSVIDLVIKTCNTLLAWNSPLSFNARLAICDIHLTKYAKLFYLIPMSNTYREYLGIIQEKWNMNEDLYFLFLNEYYRCIFHLHQSKKLPNNISISEKILLFYTQYHLEYKPTHENLRNIVKKIVV